LHKYNSIEEAKVLHYYMLLLYLHYYHKITRNISAAQNTEQKLKDHDEILMELVEDRGVVANELKNMNRRLDRIERSIEGK